MRRHPISIFFFFNDTATTEIYTLSLHDALPIFNMGEIGVHGWKNNLSTRTCFDVGTGAPGSPGYGDRSEEHTSELQSQSNLVCRLLLEKKKSLHVEHSHSQGSGYRHSSFVRNPR